MLQDIRKIFRRSHRFFGVLGLADRIEHVLGDVQDLRALRSCFESVRPDMVFHLAAQSLVRPSYDDPVDTFRTNVMGTVNLLDCVRRATHVVQAAVIIATDTNPTC